jgi:acyl carrier protein
MSFDELVGWLDDRMRLPATEGGVSVDTALAELDSLQLTELWIASEDLGLDLPEDLFASLRTLGDLFYYYETKSV